MGQGHRPAVNAARYGLAVFDCDGVPIDSEALAVEADVLSSRPCCWRDGCAGRRRGAHSAIRARRVARMRILCTVALVAGVAAGCTPYIPVKDDFAVSALAAPGEVPPEFAAFNAYDPSVGGLLAEQICATPPTRLAAHSLAATPGQIERDTVRCDTHRPLLGN